MGLFDMFKGAAETAVSAISKVATDTATMFRKAVETAPDLEKSITAASICLKKSDLEDHRAQVCLVLDISASMAGLYSSGAIQQFANRIVALSANLDDDGSVDLVVFGENAKVLKPLIIGAHAGYIGNMLANTKLEGATNYAKAIAAIDAHYANIKTPVFVVFLTDGDASDQYVAEKQMAQISGRPIFFKFVAIGEPGSFRFLNKLDTLPGRVVDNAHMFSVTSPTSLPDEVLYDNLLKDYPQWLKAVANKEILK